MLSDRVVQSWMGLIRPMNQKCIGPIFFRGYEVGEAYNMAFNFILSNPVLSTWKYVLTIEEDNLPPPDGLIRLYESMDDYDCVGGLYWTKGEGGQPMIYGDPAVEELNFIPQIPKPDTVQPANGLGMGFNLWKLDMFKDERMVGAVAGQLRKVYDGQLTKETGVENRDGNGGWQGRISWITAMTPGAERKWVRHNPMGERFSIVRWRAARNHEAVSKKVLLQSAVEAKLTYLNADKQMNEQIAGPRKWIGWLTQMLIEGERYAGQLPGNGINEGLLRELVNQLQGLDLTPKPDSPSEQLVYDGGLYALAEVVTQLRTIPNRPDGRNIGQVLDRESSGRLQHQLIKAARGWAYLHRREVEAADMRLVQRVAEDSIPISKKPIVDALYKAGRSGMWMDLDSLRIEAGYQTQAALVWQLQELLAVGVVMTSDGDIQRNWENPFTEWKLTEQFEELWRKGGLGR
jgi:hypothetical protein